MHGDDMDVNEVFYDSKRAALWQRALASADFLFLQY